MNKMITLLNRSIADNKASYMIKVTMKYFLHVETVLMILLNYLSL